MPTWNDHLKAWEVEIKDNCIITISPMIGFFSLDVSRYPPDGFYLNRWYYHTIEQAFTAARNWLATDDFKSTEPQGWFRNPRTGRRIDD